MIRLIRTTTRDRLRQERDDARQAAEHESADAATVREELFENMDALAAARQETKDTFEGMRAVVVQVTRERDQAREQLGEARRQAAAFEKEAKEYHRALVAEQLRSDEAEQLRAEREILHQAARAVGLTILLRYGWYHSVHPDLEAAKRCAEQHGASRYGWALGSGLEGTPDWSVIQYSEPQAPAAPTHRAEETKEVTS